MSYSCIPVGWIAEDSKLKKKNSSERKTAPMYFTKNSARAQARKGHESGPPHTCVENSSYATSTDSTFRGCKTENQREI